MVENTNVLVETDQIYNWVQSLNYTFSSTIMQGVILFRFPNRNVLDCVLEEICAGKYGSLIQWNSVGRERLVLWHKDLP